MALGFQRIHDLGPLSMKLLNDQFDQLWKKVMGGLDTRDMTETTAAKINAAVSEGNFTSLIQQHGDEIRLAVGSSPSDNLIRNGNAVFDTEGWSAQGCDLTVGNDDWKGGIFVASGAGNISQGPFQLKAKTKYTLCFAYQCAGGISAAVEGADAQGETAKSIVWEDYRLTFTTQAACTATVKLVFGGAARFCELMLSEGDGGSWRQNPNEVKNSSITLTDERVSIDTRNFALRLYNALGQAVTEMNADEQGFSKLYIAENMLLRGKTFYLGDGEHHLWVHPDASRLGERKIFTSRTEPVSLAGCFPDIQEAIDAIPRWCDGEVTVHIWGGGAWQYPSSKVVISHFFGGGKIALAPWTAQHYTLKRVEVKNNSLIVDIMSADINSCSGGDCFRVDNSVCMLYECRVNGRYMLSGVESAGYDAAYGALILMSHCEAHQCHTGAHAHLGGRIFMEYCAGSGNYTGCMASTGGIIQQSYSTFAASRPHFESSGGKILAQVALTQSGTAPTATPMESAAKFTAATTGCLDRKIGAWVTSPDWIRAADTKIGVMWFNAALQETLRSRTIIHASLTMRRRGTGGRAGGVPVRLAELISVAPSGAFGTGTNHGVIGTWGWGEKKTVPLPVAVVVALQQGFSKGLALYADEEVDFEGASEHAPILEVIYR